jgi:7-cyano-7-deazaguanine synthase in queuosine biosynthesis
MVIPFDSGWKKVAISVSGGADSALLAFLICCKITDQEVHIISHTRCWKTKPWQQYDSLNVFEYLVKKFPNIKFQRHTNFIAPDLEYSDRGPTIIDEYGKLVSGDNAEIRAFAEYICYTYDIDIYYNAVTRNPKDVEFKGMPSRDIDATEENKHLELTKHMGRLAAHPFRFIEKSHIVRKYRELGIMDLFEITRSCEGTFDNLDYRSYTVRQHVPTCGECFWCKEREWAIEQSK